MARTRATPAPEPTREQLELAFRQLRRPDRWPATLDAALQHPTLAPCLRAMARSLGRPRWAPVAVAPTLPQGQPVPPTPAAPPPRQQPARPRTELGAWPARRGGHDAKRLAANDTDD